MQYGPFRHCALGTVIEILLHEFRDQVSQFTYGKGHRNNRVNAIFLGHLDDGLGYMVRYR